MYSLIKSTCSFFSTERGNDAFKGGVRDVCMGGGALAECYSLRKNTDKNDDYLNTYIAGCLSAVLPGTGLSTRFTLHVSSLSDTLF